HVRRLFEGAPGEILLATASGLQSFDGTAWRVRTCDNAACSSVFAVLQAADGGLWAGTAAGLYHSDGDGLVRVESPPIERPIFFMVRDRQQRVWFGTDNGVLRWDGQTLRHFTVRDGLAGRETHRAAGLVDSSGDVWIGTERGVTVYSERLPGPRRAPPIVELIQVDASGRILALDSALPDSALDLGHDENDLIFHFRVTSLLDEERLQVEHRLEGDEPEWRPLASANDRRVRYTNLSPGEYRLQLRAANAEGLWSDVTESATITVARPYWQRPWFFLALATVAVAVAYSGQRLLAQRRYSRRLEAEVADRVAELRASEQRYRHVFERSQAVKLLLDADTLKILDANRAACRFYGHSPEALRQRTLHDLRIEDSTDILSVGTESGTHLLAERHRAATGRAATGRAATGRAATGRAATGKSAGGTVRDVELYFSATEAEGRSILYVIVQDVTERRLAEESMTTERARLAVTLRNIDNGIITTDAEGKILLANRKIAEITGWAEEDMVGKRLGEVLRIHAEGDGESLGQRLHIPMTDEALRPIRGAILVTVSGDYRLVELSGSLIRRPDGEISGLVLALRDVTERRQIENELAKTQKLEAVGLLAGGIAHDFNNLLTVLLGNLSLLNRDLAPDSRQAKNLANAEAAVLRARDLTHQLLTFSRGGTPIREAASITEVISESASFVLSGSKVSCEIDLPHDLWVVEIDAGQIHQVINNLLINAVQAMPEGGRIQIKGDNLDRAPQSLPPGRYVAIHVIDQGIGIRREHLERIFDPYFSTKKEGRGLGLASAYSIAKQHDGLLTLASEAGQGTTFSLYLPAAETAVVDRQPTAAAHPGGGGRILIMDDEREVREITGSIVERLGYRVAFAADGMQAIACYSEALDSDHPFDAVIMDLTVRGGMGGKTAIQHLRDLDPSVRAIVASGYSNDPVLARYQQYGFQGRISKPFQSEDLARVLDDVLAAGDGNR
ncbi:MAG: PAS domain S-box protein, partial [Thermoanaerobaculia bacterium]